MEQIVCVTASNVNMFKITNKDGLYIDETLLDSRTFRQRLLCPDAIWSM